MNPVIKALLEIFESCHAAARERGERGFVTKFEERSGYERTIINRWRHKVCGGNISTVCAVANALGYRLVLEKIEPGEAA